METRAKSAIPPSAGEPGAPEGPLAAAVERLAAAIGEAAVWMDSKEAAEFLRMNHSEFKRLAAAGEIPRHRTTENRYRYHAPELTDWLLAR